MSKILLSAALLTSGMLAAIPAAHATSGQITSFSASATSVPEGTWVDFLVGYSIDASSWSGGGSNLDEPEPAEGYQTWNLNWYSYQHETISDIWLEANGQTYNVSPGGGPGSGTGGSWSFSVLFPTAGTFDITVNGGWNTSVESYHSNESAWRDCFNNDPGGTNELVCTGWTYVYDDGGDTSVVSNTFGSQSLTVQVTAVPEPGALALLLAGAGVLAGWARRRGA